MQPQSLRMPGAHLEQSLLMTSQWWNSLSDWPNANVPPHLSLVWMVALVGATHSQKPVAPHVVLHVANLNSSTERCSDHIGPTCCASLKTLIRWHTCHKNRQCYTLTIISNWKIWMTPDGLNGQYNLKPVLRIWHFFQQKQQLKFLCQCSTANL